jgi:hypothetical protein
MFLMNLNEMVLPEANGGRAKAMAPVESPAREMVALPKRGAHLRPFFLFFKRLFLEPEAPFCQTGWEYFLDSLR